MRRVASRLLLAGLLVAGLAGPADAARPTEPYISHMTGTAQWVVDSFPPYTPYYVLDLTIAARGIHSPRYVACLKVYFPDADPIVAEAGFPRTAPGVDATGYSFGGLIPDGARSVTVTAQLMRLGAKQCCTAVGALRTVTGTIPIPPDPSDTSTRFVFDVTFTGP